eukprot:scaffold26162_cov72-Phaeocystis_antarctica.AAC.2
MAQAQLATHQRALWSTYDQLKLNLAGLAARASDFVELLGATRAQTSGLARCHGAAGLSYRTPWTERICTGAKCRIVYFRAPARDRKWAWQEDRGVAMT